MALRSPPPRGPGAAPMAGEGGAEERSCSGAEDDAPPEQWVSAPMSADGWLAGPGDGAAAWAANAGTGGGWVAGSLGRLGPLGAREVWVPRLDAPEWVPCAPALAP